MAGAGANERIRQPVFYDGSRFAETAENAQYAFDIVGGGFRCIGFENMALDFSDEVAALQGSKPRKMEVEPL
jgi:hypothetical protein